MNSHQSPDLINSVLLSASVSLHCIDCGVEEYVASLDDQPIDEVFVANYLCDDCEKRAG